VPPSAFAWIRSAWRCDGAFGVADRAIEVRDPWIMPIRTHPMLDPLRPDPRFQLLLRKMNLG
jgi:hypothetical protein